MVAVSKDAFGGIAEYTTAPVSGAFEAPAALDDTTAALHQRDYVRVLERLARVRPQVDAFFDQVMVNADDPAIRGNRLALLKRLADRFGAVAAIGHLSA